MGSGILGSRNRTGFRLGEIMNVLKLDNSLQRPDAESARRLVCIITFGCQMNEYDSNRVKNLLAGLGFAVTQDMSQADLIFINTCSIREKAVQKVYSFLGRLKPLKAARPDLTIVVGGCVAQQEGALMIRRAPIVDVVVGTHGVNRLPDLGTGGLGGRSSGGVYGIQLRSQPAGKGQRKGAADRFFDHYAGLQQLLRLLCCSVCEGDVKSAVRPATLSRKPKTWWRGAHGK